MALKIARIADFCGKSSGLADFEDTVDRESAVIFDTDFRLYQLPCVRILSPKQNLGYRSFFSVSRYVNEFIQSFCCLKRSSFKLRYFVKLLLELYCVIVIKHVAFFTAFG